MRFAAIALAFSCLTQACLAIRLRELSRRSRDQDKKHDVRNLQESSELPILINCGGGEYTDVQGRVWQADNNWFEGGRAKTFANEISHTEDDTVISYIGCQEQKHSYAHTFRLTSSLPLSQCCAE